MRNVAFTPVAFQEYNEWFEANDNLISPIKILIRDIDRDPFKGIGKPEPLKGNWSVYWSRLALIRNIGWFTRLQIYKSSSLNVKGTINILKPFYG